MALLLAVMAAAPAAAHRRDEYLQAARVAIDPDRVRIELDLTPGIAVADRVLADIDGDGDGSLSPAEAQGYAGRVLAAIAIDVDGVALTPHVIGATVPEIAAVRDGEGTIALQIAGTLPPLASGPHHLGFRNTHRPDVGVYLTNALVPSNDRVRVTGQDRDADQRSLRIDYTLTPARTGGEVRREWLFGLLLLGGVVALTRRRP